MIFQYTDKPIREVKLRNIQLLVFFFFFFFLISPRTAWWISTESCVKGETRTDNRRRVYFVKSVKINYIIIMIIIISLFESQIILTEHECCTNWGDCKSNKSNQIKSKVGFCGEGKTGVPGEKRLGAE